MRVYAIDFETHYTKEYSIKTLGVDAYVNHPDFDPYLVAIYGEDVQWVGDPRDFDWSRIEGANLVAHNARFDETVFVRAQQIKRIPAKVEIKSWFCSADLAVYLQASRSLMGACSDLLGIQLNKEMRDKLGKMTYREAVEKGLKKDIDAYALEDAKRCYELFTKFSAKWPEVEQKISQINREASRKGVRADVARLDEYLEKMKITLWEAGKLMPWEWDENKTPLSAKTIRTYCRKEGIRCPESFAKTDEDCQNWEEEFGEKHPWVGAMRDWRRSNIMLGRLKTVKSRLTPEADFPYTIKYFGAHTGRFAGDGGFNMQNMPRGENMGVDLRSLFIPRPGKKMVVADLAQIEARILLYLAGDTATLDEIAKGTSVYEAHAIRTMGYDKSLGKLKEVDPKMYQLAKARVLGLGYGCGHVKFQALAKLMCDINLTAEESKKVVDAFRSSNPLIVSFWNRFQRDCAWSDKKDYSVELPSGRTLNYFGVQLGQDGMTASVERGGLHRVHVYGGKIAENVIQAVARDVFTEGMVRLADKGWDILFHAHDEYVMEVDLDVPLVRIKKEIIKVPEWLEGCPLDAEIQEVPRYTK